MITIDPKTIPTAKMQGYLQSSIGPRPIAFASTMDGDGNPNLSPFSFFNVFSANPPILVFSPARRVRDNSIKHTLMNCEATKEVVINVVNYDLVQQTSLASTEYATGVDEFIKSGLTQLASDLVKPFRVKESPVQFECKVNEVISLGNEGGAGNLIVCEVVKLHINEDVLNEKGSIDHYKIDLVARAGGSFYSRARDGFFEIPKPISTLGIGVDQIPASIRSSTILTGNDLGILGNVEQLPTSEEIQEFKNTTEIAISETPAINHKVAQEFLAKGDVITAWKILLVK